MTQMLSSGLPRRVDIREVGPRDGFQNEPETIATQDKVRLIELLLESGVPRLEATAFVRADVVPQLADGAEVLRRLGRPSDASISVLIPNERGLERALELRECFDEVSVFLSASETHNRANVNCSIADSIAGLGQVLDRAGRQGLGRVGVIATSFGCPYEGPVPAERVLEIAEELAVLGCTEVGFGDTTGMANPVQVADFFARARDRFGPPSAGVPRLTAHFHNTRGQGLANVVAALHQGVDSFESSFGELGGCPVPPGSTGNIATEDLVSMLDEMGVETGIDLPKLLAASREVQTVLGRQLGSHVLRSGPVKWGPAD